MAGEKHGTSRRRSWRKLHIGANAASDAAMTDALLDQIADPLASFTADGDYDQDRVYQTVTDHHPDAAVIVPPWTTAVLSASCETPRHNAIVICG